MRHPLSTDAAHSRPEGAPRGGRDAPAGRRWRPHARWAPAATLAFLALVGPLAADAAACPYCSLSQGVDTLVYILGFLVIPYVIVSFTWWWMKRVLASEHEG